MLHNLEERDFEVLKEPLVSGRQSPDSLAFALVLSGFLQALVYYLLYYVAAESTNYPNVEKIQTIHFWFTFIVVILSFIYSIPFVYRRSEKIQYLLSILASQNIANVSFYLISLFLIGEIRGITVEFLILFTKITLSLGVLLVFILVIRFYRLLKNGHYRKGTKKDRIRKIFEGGAHTKLIIYVTVGAVYAFPFILSRFISVDFSDLVIL